MNLVQTDGLPSTQVLVPGSPPIAAQSSSSSTSSSTSTSSSSSSQKLHWPDKLEVFFFPPQRASGSSAKRWNPSWCLCQFSAKVCREFQRGNCARGEMDCRFAHPSDSPMIDTTDNTVTVCMDYIKSRCSREKCKYFHPPAHLQAKIKSSQQQISQTAAAGQTASVVRHYWPLCLCWCTGYMLFISLMYLKPLPVQIKRCTDLLGWHINQTQNTEVLQMCTDVQWLVKDRSCVMNQLSCVLVLSFWIPTMSFANLLRIIQPPIQKPRKE